MNCCRPNCVSLSVVTGVAVGVILGILYALGFISTGIIFWAYLAIGVFGIALSPIYASGNMCNAGDRCYCRLRELILTASIGAIIAAAIGLIVATIAPVAVVAIVLGLATLFSVMLLVSLICLTNCLCQNS